MIVIPIRKTFEEIEKSFFAFQFSNPNLELEILPGGFIYSNCGTMSNSYKTTETGLGNPFMYTLMDRNISKYGFCDSPQQLVNKYWRKLSKTYTPISVFITQINVEDQGGMRWHKHGEYIGKRTDRGEYLRDSKWFTNNLYSFHIEYVELFNVDQPFHTINKEYENKT
jgi:hypothetical protein